MRGGGKATTSSSNAAAAATAKRRMAKKKAQNAAQDGSSKGNSSDLDPSGLEVAGQQYSGLGPDSIVNYAEQTSFEHLSEELCFGFAEDLSYKLRSIIHNSLTKARVMGRNYIDSNDVSASFQDFNIEPVLGATSFPHFRSLNEHNLYYMDDYPVDLVDMALRRDVYIQPAKVTVSCMWTMDMERILRDYFRATCFALVSAEKEVRDVALNQVKLNPNVGPIAEWFYHFAYFLLSKDITYDCLTLRALDLVVALEANLLAVEIVSEKQMKLLVRLILQRLLRSATTEEVLKPMCRVLGVLCRRDAIHELVCLKIAYKMDEIKEDYSLPLVLVVNELGADTVSSLLGPSIEHFLAKADGDPQLSNALLSTYNVLIEEVPNCTLCRRFYDHFGGSLLPFWRPKVIAKREQLETNWLNLRVQLLKTRRRVHCSQGGRKLHFGLGQAFEGFAEDLQVEATAKDAACKHDGVRFRLKPRRSRVVRVCEEAKAPREVRPALATVGKISSYHLHRPLNETGQPLYKVRDKCCDHSFSYVI